LTVTEEVVNFIRSATPPAPALDRASEELDRFRRAGELGGSSGVVRALENVLTCRGKPAAEVGNHADPSWTAWISGTAAAVEADNGPSWVAVCAASFAVDSDPARAVEATAVGYEVAERLLDALGNSHTAAGWSGKATAGTIGAGAAAGRLLGLSAAHLRDLLGLCATQAAGLVGAEGTAAGVLQAGKAAGTAVEAAYLSRNGFTSSAQPLEGRRGLFALMSETSHARVQLGAGWR
jgi:2-methylcitrate dehydratase PrpD